MRGKIGVLFAIAGMALLLGGSARAAEPIKVGAILAVTGPASFLGGPESRTLTMLADEVNASEGDAARSAVAFGEDAFVFAAESSDTLLAWVSQPLDSMTASVVPKSRVMAGAVSVGDCVLSQDISVPVRPPLFP